MCIGRERKISLPGSVTVNNNGLPSFEHSCLFGRDAGEDGMSISPLRNTDRKGGAFIIMLQQFRRALGVMVVRGMANHKLSRLHYVRATAEEAKFTAEANHSNNRWKAGQQRSSSWYSSHTPEGYATYEQFRNGNNFGTL